MNVAEEEEVSMAGEEKGGASGGVRDGEVRTAAAGAGAVSLETLRKRMADFATERDWEQFHSPRNLLLALVRLLHFSTRRYSFTCDISLSPIS
jgi:dCTP diphosphatase